MADPQTNDSKIVVDQNLCIGCGMCVSVCPSVFRINQNLGKAEVQEGKEKAFEEASTAIDMCPMGAISYE